MAIEPVGLSQDLAAQRVIRAQVSGQDLAIWRSASLSVQAWGNRCPHRGMRLSHGFVRGESLACAYHGWHYNCQAACHYIPAHPELDPPTSIKPEVFSVIEQDGILWVGVDEVATPLSLPENFVGLRTITFECNIADAEAAFIASSLENESQEILSANEFCADPKILSLSGKDGADSVFLLFQQVDTRSVNVHVLAERAWSVNGRIRVSRWCESVRRSAEKSD